MGMLKALWILVAIEALAQTPAFEAATIKPSKDVPGHSGSHSRTGMIVMTGQTLKGLICATYQVKDFQVTGGPKWIDADRFDINAKAEGAANDTLDQLADRFAETLRPATAAADAAVFAGVRVPAAHGAALGLRRRHC